MADKIQVAVRVRPVLFQKKDVEVHWACEQGMVFQIEPGTRKRIGNPYLFDQVFGTETLNYKIFTNLVQPLIDSAMNGFNVTVLAYGQTASGKTYTMMGSQKELGIVQLVVERIFTLIEQNPERAFLLRCSYIEIYNESISDLLSSNHQKLKVQELAEGHVVVHNLIETNVNTPDAVLKLMQQGNKQRKVGGTSMNERSSRSHTIFRIIVESVPRDEADRSDAAVIVSHINLVDLAGSEKASQTNATGDRFREGCAINTSLSALSLVIKQLSEGEGFVNFRDSKLTHILRASLGGNARTAIICNVTPTVLDETSSTLKFACSAKAVQNQPHVNEVLSDQALLRKYNNYIKDLEKKLKEKECEKRPEALEEMQRLLQEKDMKINELKEQLVVSSCSEFVSARPEDGLTAAQRSLRRMTWGGNRLKQSNFPPPVIFESTPLFPRSASHFANRQGSMNNLSSSEMTLDEIAGESDSIESETFLPAEMVFSKISDPTAPLAKVDKGTMTDIVQSPFKIPGAPCTPVPVLRERVASLRVSLLKKEMENADLKEEFEELTNFTRLEQEIGVHAQATAKHAASPESADQLHRALQTANDMEVLYLDTQRKFSELQTEFRNKEIERESEIESQCTDFQHQLETELHEKKRLAKELTELKEKFDRLEKDQSEADIHLQVVTERHAKREADLRQTLQEAWKQLEVLGQDPKAITDNLIAKQRVAEVEEELIEIKKRNDEAQSRIDSLSEELRQIREAPPKVFETVNKDDQMHDNSLTGMCLADELRDVFSNQECSFVSRTVPRTRKRPSSILSVALAKMDQSACMLDVTEQEIEPSKKTRLSIQSLPSEELDYTEVKEIREYLVELQTVLQRYEADFDVLSREKEVLNEQLLNAQSELASLREEKNKTARREETRNSSKKMEISEVFDSSCFMDEPSMSASMMDMDQTAESDDQFPSLREQLIESGELPPTVMVPDAAALRIQKVDESNKRKQELEEELAQMADKFNELQKDVDAKTTALEESLRSLEIAYSTIESLEKRDGDREQLLNNLKQIEEQVRVLREESSVASKELEKTCQSLEDARSGAEELAITKDLLMSQLEKANLELEAVRLELRETLEQLAPPDQVDLSSFNKSSEELSNALERVKTLEIELEQKTTEANAAQIAAQNSADLAGSKVEELVQISLEKDKLEEVVQHLKSQLQELQEKLEKKSEELSTAEDACEELNQAVDRVKALELQLEIKSAQADADKSAMEQSISKVKEIEQILLEESRKSAQMNDKFNELQKDVDLKTTALEESLRSLEIAHSTIENLEKRDGEREQLLNNFKQIEEQVRVLRKEASVASKELEKTCQSLEDARSGAEELAVTKDLLLSQLEKANLELGAVRLELQEKLEKKNEELSTAQETLEELNQAVDRVKALELQLEMKSVQADADKSTMEQSISKMKEIEQISLEKDRKLAQMDEKFNELQTDVDAKTTALEESLRSLEIAHSTIEKRDEERERLLSNFKQIEEQVRVLREEASVTSKELEKTCQSLEDARSGAEELAITKDLLLSQLEKANLELGAVRLELQEKLEKKNEELSTAQDTLEELNQAVDRVKALELQLEMKSLQADADKSTMEQSFSKMKEIEKILLEKDRELFEAHSKVVELTQALEQSSLSLEATKTKMIKLEDTCRTLHIPREDLTAIESECKEALSRISQLESSLQEKTNEVNISSQNMEAAVSQCQELRETNEDLLVCLENSKQQILELKSRLQSLSGAKEQLEQNRLHSEAQMQSILQDYQHIKETLAEAEKQIQVTQGQRDEFCNQVRVLNEQIGEVRTKANALENSSKYHSQHKMEEMIATLKRELVDARSKSEISRLNFETEEDNRKKKIDRLEKEVESVKLQYVKCKEQLRLFRHRPNEEATVLLPQHRVSVATESICTQTDPIADKGFGFRWQMEQYVSDNERLRKKASVLGERMEFYKEKLIKYREMYFAATGQDPNQRPLTNTSSNASAQHERHSSTSSNQQESVSVRIPKENSSAQKTLPKLVSPLPPVAKLPEQQYHEEIKPKVSTMVGGASAVPAPAATRWPGVRKESLTKEELEKLESPNNCNQS